MRQIVFAAVLLVLIVVGWAVSERHYIQRYLTFQGDPMVVPLGWFDPVDRVAGRQDDDLPVATAGALTIDSGALEAAAAFAKEQNSQALIVVHRGVVQLERYWQGAHRDTRFNPQSMSKTVLGLLMGAAIADGHIGGVDDSLGNYIHEWADDARGAVTIRQALGMAAGLEQMATSYENSFFSRGTRYNFGDDFDGMILELGLVDPPGTRFEYNNEETNLLGIVIERATGQRYASYLAEKIWQPLELADADMYLDRTGGSVMKSCCIFSRPYDWAKLGQLVLNRGRHEGRQILPAGWIQAMITPSALVQHYGYKIWLGDGYIEPGPAAPTGSDRAVAPDGYLADDMIVFLGFGGQRVWISPRHELVIVRGTAQWPVSWVETRIPNLIIQGLAGRETRRPQSGRGA